MNTCRFRASLFAAMLSCSFFASSLTNAQSEPPAGWITPYPAFQVIGPLYGVGMLDLSVFLITSDEGHILINTGLADSTQVIRRNIESLGFRLEDVRILLTMQAHWDHTAAMAEIKQIAGAQVWATAKDARVLEDGGFSDAHFGGRESFDPVEVDRILKQDEIITLGDLRITVHEHPGHTEGSSSYSFKPSHSYMSTNAIFVCICLGMFNSYFTIYYKSSIGIGSNWNC